MARSLRGHARCLSMRALMLVPSCRARATQFAASRGGRTCSAVTRVLGPTKKPLPHETSSHLPRWVSQLTVMRSIPASTLGKGCSGGALVAVPVHADACRPASKSNGKQAMTRTRRVTERFGVSRAPTSTVLRRIPCQRAPWTRRPDGDGHRAHDPQQKLHGRASRRRTACFGIALPPSPTPLPSAPVCRSFPRGVPDVRMASGWSS
jgi:hypothetical protein